jgi:threonine/homoserine/homoserine lactone efflux protein
MSTEMLLALGVFAFVSSITPGPNNLMLLASGANFGFVRSAPHALGVTLGFMLMVLLVGLGAGQVFQAFPFAHTVLTALCTTYLLYLAWKIATAAPPSDATRAQAKPMRFLEAAAFQWVNPKGWTMALTAATAYAPTGDLVLGYALIALVFGLVNLPAVTLWMSMGVQLRRFLSDRRARRTFNIVAALLLVGSLYPVFF